MALPEYCPLCRSGAEHQRVVTSRVYGAKDAERAFYHCLGCDVRYMHPGLTPEDEARFYAAEFEGFMASRAGAAGGWTEVDDHIRANEPNRLRRMGYLKPFLERRASVLEIGCSSGFMLLPLIEAGHACSGVEPSGVFRDHLRSRGLSVHTSLDQVPASGAQDRFDIVMHFFVLEHIAKARAFLEQQLTLLKPGGKIIFADPLYSVYDVPAFERFYWSIAHPWYFSEASLRYLLDQVGRPYEIKRDQRYDLSNHMVWARDGRPGGMGRFTEILGRELEESYKQGLIRSGRCDTLVGIVSNV